jgi:enoyl-CoA hydratase/carnithine racemase
MDVPFIITERSGSIRIIRLNRPEALNVLSLEMLLTLSGIFIDLNKQPELRAIIITGTGVEAFCAGLDTGGLSEQSGPQTPAREMSRQLQMLCNQIENCRVPVIAAINGVAVDDGSELALACHLKIASPDVRFILTANGADLISTVTRQRRLTRDIANARALGRVLTSDAVSAQEALQLGLINRVVAAHELLSEAQSLADEIAGLAPLAIRACLEAVNQGVDLPLEEGLALESKLFASLFSTEDVREGTRAFLEKRAPVFKGK